VLLEDVPGEVLEEADIEPPAEVEPPEEDAPELLARVLDAPELPREAPAFGADPAPEEPQPRAELSATAITIAVVLMASSSHEA
jgi:hypothetical protein